MDQVVSVGDFKISNSKCDTITTHALGSCIAITIYDRVNTVGGMLHFLLPDNREPSIRNPLLYAETAIPIFLNVFVEKGGQPRRSEIKIAGGASINNDARVFDIGNKNIYAAKYILDVFNLNILNEDVGNNYYRTLRLYMKNGKTIIKNHLHGEWEL